VSLNKTTAVVQPAKFEFVSERVVAYVEPSSEIDPEPDVVRSIESSAARVPVSVTATGTP